MREAIEHVLSRCELRRRAAIILLVEEEAGFLPVDIIHVVQDPVFPDRYMSVQVRLQSVERHETGPLLHALFLPEPDIVALVDRVDLFTARTQRLQQERKQLHLSQLHAQRESTCATRIGPKRSTVRPGKPSASPKIRRQLSKSAP